MLGTLCMAHLARSVAAPCFHLTLFYTDAVTRVLAYPSILIFNCINTCSRLQLFTTQYANLISQNLFRHLAQLLSLSCNPRRIFVMYINRNMSLVSSVSEQHHFPTPWHMCLSRQLQISQLLFPPDAASNVFELKLI